ncbi:MAG TPA: DNA cytosine methyltransferase [Candidatus Elarobacter sp.]
MIRASDDEKAMLDSAAEREGLPTATWARSVLLKAVKSEQTVAALDGHGQRHQVDQSLQLLSLFSGPGGLDEGFRQAGFHTRIAFDIDEACIRTFNHNHRQHGSIAYRRDITELDATSVRDLGGTGFRPIGVIGGPPCQSFSVSNVFQTDSDPRHSLPAVYARLLKALNDDVPISFFLFENVPGLLGVKHRHRYEQFKELFAAAGFEISEKLIDARDFNVPQQRERIFIVGINRELHPDVEWVWPNPRSRVRTVRDAISRLPEPIYNEKGRSGSDIPFHPNHWSMVPRSKKFGTEGALKEGQAWGRSFRTLSWDEPSWTVAYGNREVHVHPGGKRRLSIYEAMLLQSFPSDYVLTGNISTQVRLVSEAVAPRVAFFLALALRSCLGI